MERIEDTRNESITIHASYDQPTPEVRYHPESARAGEFVAIGFPDVWGSAIHHGKVGHSEVRVDAHGRASVLISLAQLRVIVAEGSRIIAEVDGTTPEIVRSAVAQLVESGLPT